MGRKLEKKVDFRPTIVVFSKKNVSLQKYNNPNKTYDIQQYYHRT